MSKLDELKALEEQVKQEFIAEYGTGDEEEIDEYVEEAVPEETLESVVADCLLAYMEESVAHFLAARSREMADDGRYFYGLSELEEFKTRYTSEGGDLDKLHIGKVYVKGGEICGADEKDAKFLCYEVCRKKYYDMETYYSHQKYNGEKIFFS